MLAAAGPVAFRALIALQGQRMAWPGPSKWSLGQSALTALMTQLMVRET